MEIRLSKAVELIKEINSQRRSEAKHTKLSIGITTFLPEGGITRIYNYIMPLDEEDLEYLYNKYKPKALETLEGLKNYAEELKREL